MFIPGLINLMGLICDSRRSYERLSRRKWLVECNVITPLYPLHVIAESIDTAVRTLRGSESGIEHTKEVKIEIIGE